MIKSSNSFTNDNIDWVERYGIFEQLITEIAYHMEFSDNTKLKEISIGSKYDSIYLINVCVVSMRNLKIEPTGFIINIFDERGLENSLSRLGLTRVSFEYVKNLIEDTKKKLK